MSPSSRAAVIRLQRPEEGQSAKAQAILLRGSLRVNRPEGQRIEFAWQCMNYLQHFISKFYQKSAYTSVHMRTPRPVMVIGDVAMLGKCGGQGRGRTGDLPSFRWVRTIQIGLYSHAQSVSVSCESLTVR